MGNHIMLSIINIMQVISLILLIVSLLIALSDKWILAHPGLIPTPTNAEERQKYEKMFDLRNDLNNLIQANLCFWSCYLCKALL